MRGRQLRDLVKEAEKVCVCVRERWEVKERENRRDRRQERNLTRILATVVGEKEKTGSRQETWATEDRRRTELSELEY